VAAERLAAVGVMGPLVGVPEAGPCVPRAPPLASAFASCRALHSFLWPPSFQCAFWHSTVQYRTCARAKKGGWQNGAGVARQCELCVAMLCTRRFDTFLHQSTHDDPCELHLLATTAPLLAFPLATAACTAHVMFATACCIAATTTASTTTIVLVPSRHHDVSASFGIRKSRSLAVSLLTGWFWAWLCAPSRLWAVRQVAAAILALALSKNGEAP
jgi:hypothetical protein